MGLTQSTNEEEEGRGGGGEEEEEEEDEKKGREERRGPLMMMHRGSPLGDRLRIKVAQDPETPPCEASASPITPQNPAFLGGPSVKAWDSTHGFMPTRARAGAGKPFTDNHHSPLPFSLLSPTWCIEIYLVCHAESTPTASESVVGGRIPSASLTSEGKRQARTLGAFLLSQKVHFDAVFSSPLERCKQTSLLVCQELNFPEARIEYSDSLMEMSEGNWEGLQRSEVHTSEVLHMMTNLCPDFCAPGGGESERQVEFRMLQFLYNSVLPEAASIDKDEEASPNMGMKENGKLLLIHPLDDKDRAKSSNMDYIPPSIHRAKVGSKSRLQLSSMDASLMKRNGRIENETKVVASKKTLNVVGVFSHGAAIQCLLRGLLGSNPHMTRKLCIDNTSVTLLKYSSSNGWQIGRVNDTAHLRLI